MNLKLLVKSFNIVLDPLDQLSLVLSNGASDVRAHKQGVEPDDKRVKLSSEFTKKVMGICPFKTKALNNRQVSIDSEKYLLHCL